MPLSGYVKSHWTFNFCTWRLVCLQKKQKFVSEFSNIVKMHVRVSLFKGEVHTLSSNLSLSLTHLPVCGDKVC